MPNLPRWRWRALAPGALPVTVSVALSVVVSATLWAAVPAQAADAPPPVPLHGPPPPPSLSLPPFDALGAEQRWRSSLDAFAEQDRRARPPAGGVLFVGSSSIRLWDQLEAAFAPQGGVIKRGFGGSRLADCVLFADRLVTPYQPRQVVLYAGENDLDEGASPLDVLVRYEQFVQYVQRVAPGTRIGFVSIKPSPARIALLPAIQRANRLVKAYTEGQPLLDYIDVHTPMLDEQGRPRPELYAADRLHLSAAGYALWRDAIAPRLKAP